MFKGVISTETLRYAFELSLDAYSAEGTELSEKEIPP